MYWWYLLILLTAIAYFAYRRWSVRNAVKKSRNPRCSVCGTVMEMQMKQGDSEIWVCPKCSGHSDQ